MSKKKNTKVAKQTKTNSSKNKTNLKDILNSPYLFVGLLALILIIVLVVALFGTGKNVPDSNTSFSGTANVTYYFDFLCPWCGYFGHLVLEPALQKYGEKVKVEYVPMAFLDESNPVKESHNAAQGYYCAEEQNLGQEFVLLVEGKSYAHYFVQKIQSESGLYADENIFSYILEIPGLNIDQFKTCYAAKEKYAAQIENNLQRLYQAIGKVSTPTVFVNGVHISDFKLFDEELNKAFNATGTTSKLPVEDINLSAKMAVVIPEDCNLCKLATDSLANLLRTELKFNLDYKIVYANSEDAKSLEEKYNITMYPAIFVESDSNIMGEILYPVENNYYGVYDALSYYSSKLYQAGVFPPLYYKTMPDFSKVDGKGNGALTVIEFSDYMCPFCQTFHEDMYPKLKADYIDTNKIRFIHLQYPLESLHPGSLKVSEAAICARYANMFDEYSNVLFEHNKNMYLEIADINQSERTQERILGIFSKYFGKETLSTIAKDLNIDMDEFNSCVDQNKTEEEVIADIQMAQSLLIMGTPTLIVDNEVVFIKDYADIVAAIERHI